MPKAVETRRRKPEADRKERAITVWVSESQGDQIDRAAGDIPTATWARAALLSAARAATGETKKGGR